MGGAVDATVCPITGKPAQVERGTGDWLRFHSPAAGGSFEITGSAFEDLRGQFRKQSDRIRLVSWLVDQHMAGTKHPRVTTNSLEPSRLPGKLPISRRVERMYRFLQSVLPTINSSLQYQGNTAGLPADRWGAEETRAYLRAWTAAQDDDELEMLVKYAVASGHISAGRRIALTIEGWQHLEELDAAGAAHDQAFVAMWFSDEVRAAYDDGIRPAIIETGYLPMRIDRKEHANKIDDEIIAEIRRSRFLIADFTCGVVEQATGSRVAVPRGGVYYEAGFAQGLRIPVIWTCREDHINDVHFDTRQFNHITWSTPSDLKEKLANRIGAVIGDGPHRRM